MHNLSSSSVNQANYYSHSNDKEYLSKSIFWQFLNQEGNCESAALAQLEGKYNPFKSKEPLLFGNYLHSYFESKEAHENFINDNEKDLFKYGNKDKGLKKAYFHADKCIETLENDKYFPLLYKGDKEVIVTGTINGIQWKGKIDCLDLENHIFYDLKTVQDIHKKFWPSEYVKDSFQSNKPISFAIARGYDMQMAIYKELIKQTFNIDCKPMIIAVSKQSVPDKAALSVPENLMEERMEELKDNQEHVKAIIDGEESPIGCGKCEWCRSQKQLGAITPIDEIELN